MLQKWAKVFLEYRLHCLPNPKKFTVAPVSKYVAFRAPRIMNQMSNLEGDADIEALLK